MSALGHLLLEVQSVLIAPPAEEEGQELVGDHGGHAPDPVGPHVVHREGVAALGGAELRVPAGVGRGQLGQRLEEDGGDLGGAQLQGGGVQRGGGEAGYDRGHGCPA